MTFEFEEKNSTSAGGLMSGEWFSLNGELYLTNSNRTLELFSLGKPLEKVEAIKLTIKPNGMSVSHELLPVTTKVTVLEYRGKL